MKLLKKTSLAAAIMAAPFMAQAGMVALDDASMSDVTGQAGITMEINIGAAGISVGEIEYIDEGSVALKDLTVTNVTNLTQTIDVDAAGNLLIGMSGVTGMQIGLGEVALRSTTGDEAQLVSDLSITMDLGASTTTIANLAAAGNATALGITGDALNGSGDVAILSNTAIEITDMSVNALGDAIGISGMKFYGTGGEGTKATIDQTIWAQAGDSSTGGGVYIQMGQIAGTLEIGAIELGGSSIGQVKVSDINLAGMTTRIYGH